MLEAWAKAKAAPDKVPARGGDLGNLVLGVLRSASLGPEGLHLDAIAKKVGCTDGPKLKAILNILVDDGEIFDTISRQHFAASFAEG